MDKYNDWYITNNKQNKYALFFSFYNEALITSFTKTNILLGATITDHYKTVLFSASSVKRLADFQATFNHKKLPLRLICKLLYDLSLQLKFLTENYKQTFIGYSVKNVLVIDGNKFIYLPNSQDICEITDNTIMITCPFSPDDFFQTPETILVNTIPSTIHYKSSYYSLACLIMDCLKNPDIELTNNELLERNNELLETLTIKNSKIYYLLKRCLVKEADKRVFLYI